MLAQVQKYYMASSRELVRIVSIQKSPIIHLFGESISGAATIRGFGQEKRFMKRNLYLLDCFARPFFCSLAAIEWLCLRMELLSTFVFAFCMVLLVSFPHGSIDPSKLKLMPLRNIGALYSLGIPHGVLCCVLYETLNHYVFFKLSCKVRTAD